MAKTITIPKTLTLRQILKAIDYLKPREKGILKMELEKKARRELSKVMSEIRTDNQQFSEMEIMKDITEAIEEVRSSNQTFLLKRKV